MLSIDPVVDARLSTRSSLQYSDYAKVAMQCLVTRLYKEIIGIVALKSQALQRYRHAIIVLPLQLGHDVHAQDKSMLSRICLSYCCPRGHY